MVFETVVASVVNQFLGEYIANLETNQLSLGIWSGDVVLHNLRLKKDALAKLNLPIDVLEGTLGDLTLSIPWSDLKGKPLKVAINNLYILAMPKASADYDPVEEEERAQQAKKLKLIAADQMASRTKAAGEEENTFLAQLTTKILDNLQLSISNIHIRYEDPSISTKAPFSVGITLAELSVVSTDENWKEGFSSADHASIFKTLTEVDWIDAQFLRLSQLGVYWTTDSQSFTVPRDRSKLFSEWIARDAQIDASRQYILNPVSGEGQLKMQKKYDPKSPKSDLRLFFDEFAFNLDDEQYASFIALFGSFSRYMKAYPYRMLRPPRSITPKMDPRAWFQFAIKSIVRDIHEKRRRWSWEYFRERRELRLEYIAYYMQFKSGTLDYEGKQELDELERLLSFDDIRLYRHLAMSRIKKQQAEKKQEVAAASPAAAGTWIGWITGAASTPAAPGTDAAGKPQAPKKEDTVLSAAELRQLYEAIEFDPNSVATVNYPPDFVTLSVHWELQSGSLTLRRDPKRSPKQLFRSTFQTMKIDFCQHPKSMAVNLSLDQVVVTESVFPGSLHPTLIRAKGAAGPASDNPSPFLSIRYENRPLNGSADDILAIKMLPLEIVLNPAVLRALSDFFNAQKEEIDAITTLQAVAQDAIQGVTAQTRAGLEFAIEEHRVLDLQIEVDAPIFLVPSSFTDPGAPMVVVDAGHLHVKSNPISAADKEKLQSQLELRSSDLEQFLYDTYTVRFTSVQVAVVSGLDEFRQLMETGSISRPSFLEKVDVSFSVRVSILPKAYEFAKLKIDGQLPRLHVNFSDYNYAVTMAVLDATTAAFVQPLTPAEAARLESQKAKAQPGWYRSLAQPAPLVLADSDEEFHDAVEDIPVTPRGDTRVALASRILVLFNFQCHNVSASVQTVSRDKAGVPLAVTTLASLVMQSLHVSLTQRPYDTRAKCHLGSIAVENSTLDPTHPFHRLVGLMDDDAAAAAASAAAAAADEPDTQNLVDIELTSVQPLSPDFAGTSQIMLVSFNSTRFVVSREWILDMYRFFTTTFRRSATPAVPASAAAGAIAPAAKPGPSGVQSAEPSLPGPDAATAVQKQAQSSLFVLKVKSVETILADGSKRVASGRFNSLSVQALFSGSKTSIKGTLGRLSVIDDLASADTPLLRNFLSVDDDQTADFVFELLEGDESRRAGYDSFLMLRAASVRMTYLPDFIGHLYGYFSRFQEMRTLVETARKVAEESALQMQQRAGRFVFDVVLRTPIITWPKLTTLDRLIFYLGEISAKNAIVPPVSDIGVGLEDEYRINVASMKVVSVFAANDAHMLSMIDDVNVDVVASFFRDRLPGVPAKQITTKLSQVTFNLTDDQYQLAVDLWRAFNAASAPAQPPPLPPPASLQTSAGGMAMPGFGSSDELDHAGPLASALTDVEVVIPTILLQVFSGTSKTMSDVGDKALAKFAGSSAVIKLQMREDQSMDMEWRFGSLSVFDTRVHKQTCFREIMAPTSETADQFVMHYAASPRSSSYLITVDRPKLILDVDHLFSVRAFFGRPWGAPAPPPPSSDASRAQTAPAASDVPPPYTEQHPAAGDKSTAVSEWVPPAEQPTFSMRINFVDPEIVVVRDPAAAGTDAVVLLTGQLVISYEQILAVSFHRLGMYFCAMDSRASTQLRFIDDFDATLSFDNHQTAPNHFLTNASLNFSSLVFWVSYHDMLLLSELVNRTLSLLGGDSSSAESARNPGSAASSASSITQADAASIAPSVASRAESDMPVTRERFRLTVDGIRAVFIDDVNDFHVPMFDFVLDKFVVDVADWSSQLRLDTALSLHANYFNLKNSHWEPFVEQWQLSVNMTRQEDELKPLAIDVFCRKKLELNLSHAFINTVIAASASLTTAASRKASKRTSQHPYILRNRTGYPMHIWIDTDEPNANPAVSKIENGGELGWRFDDWRTIRERSKQTPHRLNLLMVGPPWETLKGVTVDREGTTVHALRPSLNKATHRIVCQVRLQDRVKIVTFRSTTLVRNQTNMQMEVLIVNRGKQGSSTAYRVAPKDEFAVPIEASFSSSILVRPLGLGYNWCSQNIFWENLRADQPASLVTCQPLDTSKPSFRFQVNVRVNEGADGKYPNLDITFLPPFTLENLLPHDINYIIFDKATRQESRGMLKGGAADALHTLDPTHILALNILVLNTDLRQREVAMITNTELQYRDDILVLQDQAGRQLSLKLKYSEMSESGGRRVRLYSPYVLLNRTGREMCFSARSLVTTARIEVEPFMFSYSTFEPLRSRAQVKVDDSDWSKPLSFEAVGSAFQVTIPNPAQQCNVHLGVDIKDGEGKYYLTKVVTFSPRFIIQNSMAESLYFRQSGTRAATVVSANSSLPLMSLAAIENDSFELDVRLSSAMSDWSNGFNITQLGTVFIKVGRSDSSIEDLIRAEITLEKASIYITFSRQEGRWPLRIDNNSDVDLALWQRNSTTRYIIPRRTSLPYAWDYPSVDHKRIVIQVNGKEHEVDTSSLGKQRPFKYPIAGAARSGILAIEIAAEGPSTVVRLMPYNDTSRTLKHSASTQSELTLPKPKVSKILQMVQLRMEGIGISFISRDMQEIAYASAKTLLVDWTDTEDDQALVFSLKWLQIDNQIYGCMEPIFVYPTILSKEGKEDFQPVLMMSLCKSKDTSYGVEYYKWFTLLLQELSIDLDEEFLHALTDFFRFDDNANIAGAKAPEPDKLYDTTTTGAVAIRREDSSNLFFEKFLLQPMQVNISFSRISSSSTATDARPASTGVMAFIYEVLTMTIGNIHDAPIRLNALELEHPILTAPQLSELITRFYSQEILGQVHKIIGAADFLGNPVGLFNNVASGVNDMFYEPLQGFEITRPQDFGIGVARGASSLVKKTVFGVTDTLSKFTGSIGKGEYMRWLRTAAASLDRADSLTVESAALIIRNRPRHVVYGVTSGAASFLRSVTSGVTGVVSQPLKGAQESGVEGFFKGLGKGLVGVVAKPMIGVMDLATNVSEGIKNTTSVFDGELDRQRLPRFIGKDGILKPYDSREALGRSWLKSLENGRYFHEQYVAHLEIRIEDLVAIVTETRVIMARVRKLKIEWDMLFEDLQIIRPETGGLALIAKARHVAQARMIPCPDEKSAELFRTQLEGAFLTFLQAAKPFD
nr:hypothetical protein HK105_005137 [Polyrhizophydium stewartii]